MLQTEPTDTPKCHKFEVDLSSLNCRRKLELGVTKFNSKPHNHCTVSAETELEATSRGARLQDWLHHSMDSRVHNASN